MRPDTELARELRRLRLDAGLTQEALAERAGISVRAVSDAERGLRTRLYPDTADRIASAVGLVGPARDGFTALARGTRPVGPKLAPLPPSRTPLLGRAEVLTRLARLLKEPATRLVTLTGPGGAGKTRLALAAASQCAPVFDDGVAFVQLANCHNTSSAGLAIATAVGANTSRGTVADMVCAAVGTRRMLLMCDTFERVLDAAPLVGQLLSRCPEVRILATSRAPLRLGDEHLITVGPLGQAAARELFAERAIAARPGVNLAGFEPLVDEICARVQRFPLAIELAAARVAHLGLADLRDRLDRQLALLTEGLIDDDARHRTIEATVEWSYALLGTPGQEALDQLAVFDGWTLDAASHVLGTDPVPLVSALVDHSLAAAPEPTSEHGRYRMLDVVREFGAARLAASGQEDPVRDHHAAWFLHTAESAFSAMREAGQHKAHRETAADLGNLRLAFRRLQVTGRGADALRLASSLWMFWLWQGGFSEGRAWLRSALESPGDASASLRATARWGAGWLAYLQGDLGESRIHADALSALAQTSGSAVERRNALTLHGMIALADRRLEDARAVLAEALGAARELGDPWLLAVSTLNHGAGLTHIGRLDEATRQFAEARDRFAELGDDTYRARALRHLAAVRLLTGDFGASRQLLNESLSIAKAADDRWGLAETLEILAHMAAASRDAGQAGAFEATAARLRRSLGVAPHPFDAILADRYLEPLRGTEAFKEGTRAPDHFFMPDTVEMRDTLVF
jgi:predicted ATPase/DNA-binding XRE family transcriptional regulator